MPKIHVCAVGLKGAIFLSGLVRHDDTIGKVFTYEQDRDASEGFKAIKEICSDRSIALIETRRPTLQDFSDSDLIFMVGWQYLLPFNDPRLIVFHDSLLPRHRGFAPTVTALIVGDNVIGVTALRPEPGIDTGPIIAQAQFSVPRPARVGEMLQRQAELMVDLAHEIIARQAAGSLSVRQQEDSESTYSIWRDREDYFFDWTWSAEEIERFVHAVGYPYEGARTMLDGRVVIIDNCEVCEDVAFSIRQPGKVWAVEGEKVQVVCGQGMLRVSALRTCDDVTVKIVKMRSRFRNPTGIELQHLIES